MNRFASCAVAALLCSACGQASVSSDAGATQVGPSDAGPLDAAAPDAQSSPRCGDGDCSPDESCSSCPLDCGACECACSAGADHCQTDDFATLAEPAWLADGDATLGAWSVSGGALLGPAQPVPNVARLFRRAPADLLDGCVLVDAVLPDTSRSIILYARRTDATSYVSARFDAAAGEILVLQRRNGTFETLTGNRSAVSLPAGARLSLSLSVAGNTAVAAVRVGATRTSVGPVQLVGTPAAGLTGLGIAQTTAGSTLHQHLVVTGMAPAQGGCGNGTLDPGEVCDGAALDGQTCASRGYDSGPLGCQPSCVAYDEAACLGAQRTYPPDGPMEVLTYPGAMPMPAYRTPVPSQAPFTGNTITRVSDAQAFAAAGDPCAPACTGTNCSHHYVDSTWNSDQSLMLFHACKQLLDGRDFRYLRNLRPLSGQIPVWSSTDPKVLYAIDTAAQPNRFMTVNPDLSGSAAGAHTPVFTFTEYEAGSVSLGDRPTVDNFDRYTVATGQRTSDQLWALMLIDLQQGLVAHTKVMTPGQESMPTGCRRPHSSSISQLGRYAIVGWSTNDGCSATVYHVFDTSGGALTLAVTIPGGGGHGDFCIDAAGNDVLVGQFGSQDRGLYMKRLPSTTDIQVLPPTLFNNWYQHISCRNIRRPGWAYVSNQREPLAQQGNANIWQRIFAVKLEPYAGAGGTVENFAWAHHAGDADATGAPAVSPSPFGDLVIWKVKWDGVGPVYSFVGRHAP